MDHSFDRFLRYDELTAWLHAQAEAHPDLITIESYGRSYEGRDLLLATITDASTGAHDTKPAHWVDANIHAIEVTGGVAALYLIHHQEDTKVDGYYADGTAMTVFGFGRSGNQRLLSGLPNQFTFGFVDETTVNAVRPVVNGAYKPLTITGSNDDVEITSDAQTGAVTEDDAEANVATGAVTFTDLDVTDVHSASDETSFTKTRPLEITGWAQVALVATS